MTDRKPFRVLITGSRSWADEQAIRDALAPIIFMYGPENVIVVHGACPQGADALADQIASSWTGLTIERHPANWDRCAETCRAAHRRVRADRTTYCPAAGLRRDAEMVESNIDQVLAFIDPCVKRECRKIRPHGSHGASHTADLAEKAGIFTRRFPEETSDSR